MSDELDLRGVNGPSGGQRPLGPAGYGGIDPTEDAPMAFTRDELQGEFRWSDELVAAALSRIPASASDEELTALRADNRHDVRRKVGTAILKHCGGDVNAALALFGPWSADCTDFTTGEDTPEGFLSRLAPQSSSIDMGTVYKMAVAMGWTAPRTSAPVPHKQRGNWEALLKRLEALPDKSVMDATAQERLIADVAEADLGQIRKENAVKHLHRITGLGIMALRDSLKEAASELGGGGTSGPPTVADILVKLIGMRENCEEVWRSEEHSPQYFATVRQKNGILKHYLLTDEKNSPWRLYLTNLYSKFMGGKTVSQEAITQATQHTCARAAHDGKAYPVWVRVARHGDRHYYNLNNEAGQVVEIDAGGWRVITNPPVRFAAVGLPQVMPERGMRIEEVRELVNVKTDEDLMKFVGCDVIGIMVCRSYPIKNIYGEPGSAKSSALELGKLTKDPTPAPVRSYPRSEDNAFVSARNNHVITGDNISHLSEDQLDFGCRLSTGGGTTKRQLYTDGGEHVTMAVKPQDISSVENSAYRSDFNSRCLHIELDPIPREQRMDEAEFESRKVKFVPRYLGLLLDGVVSAMANLDYVRVNTAAKPRMTSLLFGAAAMLAYGFKPEQFLEAAETAQRDSQGEQAEGSALGSTIRRWLQATKEQRFNGAASSLLAELNNFRTNLGEDRLREREWPDSAQKLGRKLSRISTEGFAAIGVGYEKGRKGAGDYFVRLWLIKNGKPNFAVEDAQHAGLIAQLPPDAQQELLGYGE